MERSESRNGNLEGTIVELLPSGLMRVELDAKTRVLAHPASARSLNAMRFRPGDRVAVALSAHDPGRGRITRMLRKP